MHRSQPFAQFRSLMIAVAGIMSQGLAQTREQAIGMAGGYKSRGKGRNVSHDNGGTRAYQRLATKKRNRKAHRAACRG